MASGSDVWAVISFRNVTATASHLPQPHVHQFGARFVPLAFHEAAWGRELVSVVYYMRDITVIQLFVYLFYFNAGIAQSV